MLNDRPNSQAPQSATHSAPPAPSDAAFHFGLRVSRAADRMAPFDQPRVPTLHHG